MSLDNDSIARRSWITGAFALALAACTSEGTSASPGPSAVPSSARAPSRIVSLSPSMTETVFALGRGEWLVGRTRFCDFPAQTSSIPVVGGFSDPSPERIVALAPTLVTGERGPAGPGLVSSLEALGVRTYFPALGSIDDVTKMIAELGARLDAPDRAGRIAARIGETVALARRTLAAVRKPRVVFLLDTQPLFAVGRGSFVDELLTAAGAENLVTSGGPYPRLSPEALVALRPDVVLDASSSAHAASADATARPAASPIAGIASDRIVAITSSTVLRPGPRIAEGVAELVRLLHGPALAAPLDAALREAVAP
jgi:iron complex transport system substrate-binding protein